MSDHNETESQEFGETKREPKRFRNMKAKPAPPDHPLYKLGFVVGGRRLRNSKENSENAETSAQPVTTIDPALASVVEQLRAYAVAHSEARSVEVALEGILHSLVNHADEVRRSQDDPALAVHLLEQIATLFPDSAVPVARLSKLFVDRGEHQKALEIAETGLARSPGYSDLLFNRALCLQKTGRAEEAIVGFREYLEADPDNPWAYNNIGDAFRSIGLLDQAEEYLKIAIQKDSTFAPAHYNLAMLYMDRGDWPNCMRYALTAEQHEPSNPEVHLALADSFMHLDDPARALRHCVAATLLRRDFAEAYETMASAYAALGMFELCIAAANEALDKNPDSWQARAYMGRAYSKQGMHTEAILVLVDALTRDPSPQGLYDIYWLLGWEYLQDGDYRQALDFTSRAIGMTEFPDVELWFNNGLILVAQGRFEEAEVVYDRALTRAKVMNDYAAISQAKAELREFVSEKQIMLPEGTKLSTFLEGIAG